MNPVSKFTPKIHRGKTTSAKDAVEVFCRLRPLKYDEESSCIRLISPDTLALTTPAESKILRKEIHSKFKHIFTAYADQNEVFKHVAYPLLEDLLLGKNGLLFTYGVTGSGKTYTLTGNQENPGIMPKCIYTLFNTISQCQAPKYVIKTDRMNGFEIQSLEDAMQEQLNTIRASKVPSKTPSKKGLKKTRDSFYVNDGTKIMDIDENSLYSVFVSYVEIYNNTVFDLLDENTGRTIQGKILREDPQKNMYVNGVIETEVKSAEEAFELFNIGQKRKKMGNTILNSVSSRSHSIFNIRVVQFNETSHGEDTNLLKISQLSFADLAGSERINRTQNTGQLLREASQINNSLLSLRTCLEILRENQILGSNRLVPYRDSRLTHLFKNYFEGEGKISMIVCVNPSVGDFDENLQVMKFAETTQDVKIARSEPRLTPCKKTIHKKVATPLRLKNVETGYKITPDLPEITLNFKNMEEFQLSIERLRSVLKIRQERFKDLNSELDKKESHFRKRLLDLEQDHTLNKTEIRSLKEQLKKAKQKEANVESKLSNSETRYMELKVKVKNYENEIISLQQTIAEKDLKINKKILEKEKTKQKLALQEEKMTQELDAKLRRQREHLHAQMKAKENKILKAKEILESDIGPMEEKITETPQVVLPPVTEALKHQSRKPVLGAPSLRHRRSKSAGEAWLEHNAIKPLPLDTVLQPTMRKRKSVTKLTKATDVTNPKRTNYCLVEQVQDSEGEIETKLYKGDILPTCSGGAQVIFNDVERLRQESPLAEQN